MAAADPTTARAFDRRAIFGLHQLSLTVPGGFRIEFATPFV
jgi:hypothetical protein